MAEGDYKDDAGPLVRPYALTQGRSQPHGPELDMHTQVATTTTVNPDPLTIEHREIIDLCRIPQALAEIAAKKNLPYEVTKILVGDLVLHGALTVHTTTAAADNPAFLQRVLNGLQRL